MIGMHVIVLLCLLGISSGQYTQKIKYSGTTFFDGWTFFSGHDPSNGFVNYVDQAHAQQMGYITTGDNVYMGCDAKNVVPNGARGRDSVRIETKQTFKNGLFIMDLLHMPTGCGTWPAWWLVGPGWPYGGEIDIIEGINNVTFDQSTLHTSPVCDMSKEDETMFTGKWGFNPNKLTDCAAAGGHPGCGIVANMMNYGTPFNAAGGGVYVMEWTETFIQMFYFDRNNIPADIKAEKPQPTTWGKPYAYFVFGANCAPSRFANQTVVINLTFCGDWSGRLFNAQCGNLGACNAYVKNNPTHFTEAYWRINYVSVYQQ